MALQISPAGCVQGLGGVTCRGETRACREPQEVGRRAVQSSSISRQLHFTGVCPGEVGQGGLPGCHMVTTTSRTELDQHKFFHTTTTKPLSQPPEAAGAFTPANDVIWEGKTQPRRCSAAPHQWETAGRQEHLGRRWRRRQRKNTKAKRAVGLLLRSHR